MADATYHRVETCDDYVVLDKPGAIRWATGNPEGARSQTWQVVGARTKDDVYVSTRAVMHAIKLSLHESGIWRVALTQPAAAKYLIPGEDALIERYLEDESYVLAPGWHYALRILTPALTFRTGFAETATSDGQSIRFYRRPDPPHELEYHVLLGDADAEIPTFTNAFTVGQMTLKSGKRVLVVGTLRVLEDHTRMALQAIREEVAKDQLPNNHAGFLVGGSMGVPTFVDIADLLSVDSEY